MKKTKGIINHLKDNKNLTNISNNEVLKIYSMTKNDFLDWIKSVFVGKPTKEKPFIWQAAGYKYNGTDYGGAYTFKNDGENLFVSISSKKDEWQQIEQEAFKNKNIVYYSI